MTRNLPENLDYRKADTAGDDPEHLIIHGPTWMREFPFDDISRALLITLQKANWTVIRSRAGIHAISPFLREAA